MKYSPLSDSATYSVASNGINILKMPKYASCITQTIISTRKSGWADIYWTDKTGAVIYEKHNYLPQEISKLPMIGEVIETEAEA